MKVGITNFVKLGALVRDGVTDWLEYGNVRAVYHEGLVLFNYTAKAQFQNRWNWFERVSRGLILDATTGKVIARPFDKFWNWGAFGRTTDADLIEVTEKLDGCFTGYTKLNLWGGGTIPIREVVKKQLAVTLIGINKSGQVVPAKVVDWFNNGTKTEWLLLTVDCDVSKLSGTRTGNHIVVTPNHHILLNGRYQPVVNARPGDYVLNYGWWPDDRQQGKLIRRVKEVKVLDIQHLKHDGSHSHFSAGRVGFDVETTTGNYFAKGVLVHNSLGIMYWHEGKYKIATRGSFTSEQALWATEYLNTNYDLSTCDFPGTLLFEIIYPENRVVVDYGRQHEDLVLIGIRLRESDYDALYPHLEYFAQKYGFTLPQTYEFSDIASILAAREEIVGTEQEGWALRFADGQRFKVKGTSYLTLHRLVSRATYPAVVKAMMRGELDETLQDLPSELSGEIVEWRDITNERVAHIKRCVELNFAIAPQGSRKEFAIWANTVFPSLAPYLFRRLDGCDYTQLIYKNILKEC